MESDLWKDVKEMNIHAKEVNVDELNEMASLPDDDATYPFNHIGNPNPTSCISPDTDFDLDDILPGESFSTHVSPATSLVNGITYRKPAISLFTNEPVGLESIHPESTLPSPPKTPVGRKKDDIPCRYSDVEDSPPLRAAGFVGKEIPTLDSDGEWEAFPTLANLPTRFAVNRAQAGETDGAISNDLQNVEEKKKKKRKKKGKGVSLLVIVDGS
jgi:hypothetical protein